MKICGYDKIINYNPYDRKPVFDDVFVMIGVIYMFVMLKKMHDICNKYTNEFLPIKRLQGKNLRL